MPGKKIAGKLGMRVVSNMQPMPLTSWPAASCGLHPHRDLRLSCTSFSSHVTALSNTLHNSLAHLMCQARWERAFTRQRREFPVPAAQHRSGEVLVIHHAPPLVQRPTSPAPGGRRILALWTSGPRGHCMLRHGI
jgi:hypothetical protein